MSHKVTLLPGDGIGPEVTAAMRLCVEATGVKIDWDVQEVGEKSIPNDRRRRGATPATQRLRRFGDHPRAAARD